MHSGAYVSLLDAGCAIEVFMMKRLLQSGDWTAGIHSKKGHVLSVIHSFQVGSAAYQHILLLNGNWSLFPGGKTTEA
jgi:hypothetical protein